MNLDRIPTTTGSWIIAAVLLMATAIDYFVTRHVDGQWLLFVGSVWAGAIGQHIGKRATWKSAAVTEPDMEDVPPEEIIMSEEEQEP